MVFVPYAQARRYDQKQVVSSRAIFDEEKITMSRRLLWVLGLALFLILLPLSSALAFTDVGSTTSYSTAITDLSSRSIISGFDDGSFKPFDPVKRMQFAKIVDKTLGLSVSPNDICLFVDVPSNLDPTDPLYPDHYIAVCAANHITEGTNVAKKLFSPYDPIKRAQVITMLVRAADQFHPGLLAVPPASYHSTWGDFDPTHATNAARAEYNGLLEGLPLSVLDPFGYMPRGEVAQVLDNFLGLVGGGSPQPVGQTGQVTSVVDGDTIHVQLGATNESVRLIGMDAPEMGEDFSQQAKDALTNLVGGKTVRLEPDVDIRDQYGRLLAYVWLGTTMANAEIVRQGLATVYTVPPDVKYVDLLTAAQNEAKAAKRGIWGATSPSPISVLSANYDAPGNDNQNLNEEYITFKVLVSGSLIGYAVEDASGHHYDFPDRIFQAAQTFKLHTGSGVNTQTDLYWGASQAIWNNDGDTVKVLDPQGHVVTSYKY